MRRGSREGRGDRYDELMARHAALQALVRRRTDEHMETSSRLQPLPGGSYGASTAGVRLAPDGSLDAVLDLRHPDGRTESVRFAAAPGEEPAEVPPWRPPAPEPPVPSAVDRTAEARAQITAVADAHLPPAAAAELLGWLRPALRLRPAAEGDLVVAQLGGLPTLPLNSWPLWEGHGPLSHVLTLDLVATAPLLPELGLPEVGTLAFFYYDGRYLDDVMTTVGTWDPDTRHGARVLHLRPDRSTREHVSDLLTPAPPGLASYPAVPLAAERVLTWPSFELPWVVEAWDRHAVPGSAVDGLREALGKLLWGGYDQHQVGGHPAPQQAPVELEVEQLRRAVAGEPFDWGSPEVAAALPRWRSLLQVGSDDRAEMMWGDVGQLHWLLHDDASPEEASFTWQCG